MTNFDAADHHDTNWGMCQGCSWFLVEPGTAVSASACGQCGQPENQYLQLRVVGESGCNHFLAGHPQEAAGASRPPALAHH